MHTLEQLRSGALAGASRLDLSCSLRTVPPEVFALADSLEILNLSGNQLKSLPPDLPRLHKLKVIFCSDNLFTELPDVLGSCTSLQVVGFKANRIARVSAAALPPALRWLILTDNDLSIVPSELGERPALQKLMLAGNQLRDLPESLMQLTRLELLRLSANELTRVPPWLTGLPRLSWLALAGNPLGWTRPEPAPLDLVPWAQLQVKGLLGEGASGHIYEVCHRESAQPMALKVFKGAMTSDGLPEHELAACMAAGQHAALCTPSAVVADLPQGAAALLLPLIPSAYINLAGPPSLESCTRDVYPDQLRISVDAASRMARTIATALAHLHQRGVMHGDVYAHNILWDPSTGDALLSDFGAATLLPVDQPEVCQALLALEVRAFGCLLQELVAHTGIDEKAIGSAAPGMSELQAVAGACLQENPALRPSMAAVVTELQASNPRRERDA
jgi:hypothetical protein